MPGTGTFFDKRDEAETTAPGPPSGPMENIWNDRLSPGWSIGTIGSGGMFPPVIADYHPAIAEPQINQRLIRRTGRGDEYNTCREASAFLGALGSVVRSVTLSPCYEVP
jgi:hypothetical protein